MFKTFPHSVVLEDFLKAAVAQTCKLEEKTLQKFSQMQYIVYKTWEKFRS